MEWYYISLLLCFFGFLKEIRPSEPFVSDYMQKPYRNVTDDEVRFFSPFYSINWTINFVNSFLSPVESLHLSNSNIFESCVIDCGSIYY